MSAQPDQIIRFRTTIFCLCFNSSVQPYFGSKYGEKRYRLSRAYNDYENQTAQLIKFEFILHLMCVCVHKSDASDTQAESSLPSRP